MRRIDDAWPARDTWPRLQEGVAVVKRVLMTLGLLVGLGIVGFISVDWLASPRPGVSRSNYDRIRQGMPLQEVQSLFGVEQPKEMESSRFSFRRWHGQCGCADITFDEDDKVTGKNWHPSAEESFLDRCRRWLGL